MAEFNATTTGTPGTVVVQDLGGVTWIHPETKDLLLQFSAEEIAESLDLQAAIDGGELTITDENGDAITDVEHIGHPFTDARAWVYDDSDDTARVAVDASGITTGTTRTGTLPDKDFTFGLDDNAIHDNVANEFTALTTKATPVNADCVIIEDSADSFNKKKITLGTFPAGPPSGPAGGGLNGTYPNPGVDDGADGTAIHDNVAAEISAITAKATPVAADYLVIEDSADSNNKKSITMGDIDHDALTNYEVGEHRVINDAGTSATELWSAFQIDAAITSAVTGLYQNQGGYDAATNSPDLDTAPSGISNGDAYTVTVAGTFFTEAVEVGDVLIANQDNPTVLGDWTRINKNISFGTTAGTAAEGNDPRFDDAIHDNVAAEISAITAKAAPVGADYLLIEDSADSDNKKSITLSGLSGFIQDRLTFGFGRNNAAATNIWLRTYNGTPSNLSPYRVPFAGTLIAVSGTTNAAETVDFDVYLNGFVRAGGIPAAGSRVARLSLAAANSGQITGLSVAVAAGDEIGVFCRGTGIGYPHIDLYLVITQ